ncbi:hypothetical protein PFLUV_G00015200 [Perca fluviatilis]|uniref:Uncharacterized protein n=1 Tax=Perca fluviatilis TaxID=8168 RepID=A0A6A5FMY9_PERFL|nr:hypothetical protein PFLUV_G00015200 [Perca fluviatilis]
MKQAGLMRQYREARKAPPKVTYVDRDCCVTVGTSAVHQMYHEWHELVVRLDVWHLMQCFARGVTTDSHQLYGLFMARLSFAIFEWDAEDVARLREAEQSVEGREAHIKLSGKELARQEVLDAFWTLTDTMGVPLIDRAHMEEIWSTQRRHLDCIQDPEGVELYTRTGEVTKGGVKLPVFRCARGSTSLESFHLHQCRFIPGKSFHCIYRFCFCCFFSLLSLTLCSVPRPCLNVFQVQLRVMSTDTDEGFEEEEEPEEIRLLAHHSALLQKPHCVPDVGEASSSQSGPHHPPPDHNRIEVQQAELEEEEDEVIGPDGHPGYDHLVALAHALVELPSCALDHPASVPER